MTTDEADAAGQRLTHVWHPPDADQGRESHHRRHGRNPPHPTARRQALLQNGGSCGSATRAAPGAEPNFTMPAGDGAARLLRARGGE